MQHRIRIIVPLLLIAALAGGLWWRSRPTLASSDGMLRASGTIEAEQVLITSEIAGRVMRLAADEGQEVSEGTLVAQIDTALLEVQLEQARAAVATAEANLALLKAGARPEELAAADAALAQAQALRDGAAQAVENTAQIVANPQELNIQIAQAEHARNTAQAALRKLRAGNRAEDLAAGSASFEQAQANLQAVRDRLSATKTQAELALKQSTEALTQAQARYAQAKYNWEYAQETGNDPILPEVTNAAGKRVENKLSDGQLENYYALFVQAEAALRAAEEQVRTLQVNYDAARQAEVTGITSAEQQLAAAEATLAKLRAGATREDLAIAMAALTGAQNTLDTLVAIRENPQQLIATHDTARAQLATADAALQAALARAEQTRNGARAEQIAIAEAQVGQARAAQRLVEVQLAKAALIAPRAGLVLSRSIHEGEMVTPGTPLMLIGSLDTVQLTLYVALSDIGQVRQGQTVQVSVDSFPGEAFTGVVSFIAQQAEFTPRNVQTQAERVTTVFAVRVDIANQDHRLKPGMPADAVLGNS
jgi:HlyD family secretion protein